MYKLYVEPSDEITTVIERLKAASDDVVALIAPKGAPLLQSIVNLKLARKAAKDAGKTIVLVSTDKIGRNLGVQLGIPVVTTESEVAAALKEGSSVIEGEEPAVIGGVRIHRYYNEGDENEATAAEKNEKKDTQEPIIIPRKITETPLTQEVSTEDKGSVDEKATPLTPVEIASVVTPLETPALASAESLAEATPNTAAKPLTPPTETNITRTSMTPRPAPQDNSPKRRLGPLLAYCAILLILIVAACGLLFLPVTKATIHVPSTPWTKELSFTASTGTTTTSADRTQLPAELVTADSTDSITFNATGTKDVGNAATGTLTLYNYDSTSAQTLPSGTTVTTTSGGVAFVTQADAKVPGYSQSLGQPRIPGSAQVAVTAANPGTNANLTNAPISQISTDTLSLSGTVSASGGTSQTLPVISPADIDAAKTALVKKLTTDVQAKMQDTLKNESVHFDSATDVFTQDTPSVNVNADDQTASGQVQQTAHLQRFIVKDSDIAAAVADLVAAAATTNVQEHVSNTIVTAFTVSKDVKSVAITTKNEGKESKEISLADIKKGLLGRTLANGSTYLTSLVPNATIDVSQTPPWWPFKHFPYFSRWLTLTVTYE